MTDSYTLPENNIPPFDESVWTYRGYHLRPSEFTTAIVHFYRAEIQRSNTWRMRLDNTTNWAVITSSAAISFALSSPQNHYGVIILNSLLVMIFLWIEARRYRYYELWSLRTRLIETDFFAAMLVPPFTPHAEWAENMAESLLSPEFSISMWEAVGRRFRRNYFWIFMLLNVAWVFKIYLHPTPALTWMDFVSRAAIGNISGEVMIALGFVLNGLIILAGILTAGLTQASGEVLPKFEGMPVFRGLWRSMEVHGEHDHHPKKTETSSPRRRRQQLLAMIITTKPREVSDQIINEMRRGATSLHGQGMYSNTEREVLLVALTVTETAHLRALVQVQDPGAFVIVMPAQEVLGRGFKPLKT